MGPQNLIVSVDEAESIIVPKVNPRDPGQKKESADLKGVVRLIVMGLPTLFPPKYVGGAAELSMRSLGH
jgi:hypothetical protein